jgi:hypothetical protein
LGIKEKTVIANAKRYQGPVEHPAPRSRLSDRWDDDDDL